MQQNVKIDAVHMLVNSLVPTIMSGAAVIEQACRGEQRGKHTSSQSSSAIHIKRASTTYVK